MLSTLEKERKTRAEGRARVRVYWENMSEVSLHLAYEEFHKLPEEGEACPDLRCCGPSVPACNRRWEGMKIESETFDHYYDFSWDGVHGMELIEMGFGCAMDVLLKTSCAKHHTELTLYWAHVLNIFALMKGPEAAKYVAMMGGRLKPRQEMEKRFLGV
uniref:Uncharacterized protein n=1 Tax=Chromera velia CCMP2878 TaxID=1169474 RepID=A0A0G4HT64_9ALVE|eukprot:Cvel_8370.t1-p1 / transcript=Cvel_8370.t1 / gene=Cvel_8370 / organism=Chromera_velia_CCMP2878 / gene_product=hypothetical protein / transcript_product=hypothetical protein / location=Cvel_scaffold461:26401-26874(+) / protein_length=158 / sequence_SO=supercontig / SO=protein_coding / is_pseudo=false